ncbi:protease SohB [Spectribacter hydrogenoxidans]|uniref:Protease SohB n=1 Tax=Spectribacter hydrogenoxidans TaxID=3075608 RepID=A0ABU3C0C4_9GAMM|nr:protease SohB [Salinisphaera sp. W335]MDT0635005.1 protease SohB [Salinisphaera sp. W335]
METLISLAAEYGLFLVKAVTVVAAIGLLVAWIAATVQQSRQISGDGLEIHNVNQRFDRMVSTLQDELLDKPARKARDKRRKAETKQKAKAAKLGKPDNKGRLFVIDFDGDIRASAVTNLREEITAVLQVAEAEDEVLLRLESAGGLVHSYGLAASQLRRLRDRGIRFTAAVDKLAASGGYLMACVADRIVAAPFAIIGSIGVVGQMPNFNRLLKEKNVDIEMHTAGEHKRTLTMFGENSDAGRAKFREELESTHGLFKQFVSDNRADLNVDRVATGEHWHGTQALDLGLIDAVGTSDDLLLTAAKDERAIYEVRWKTRQSLRERLSSGVESTLQRVLSRF